MRRIPLDDKKQVFCLLEAREAMKAVIRTCVYMINNDVKPNHELYYPLTTAIYVVYSRPFMANYGLGRLDFLRIPDEYIALHEEILTYRNKVFAHKDVNRDVKNDYHETEWDLHAVFFTRKGSVIYTQVSELPPPYENVRRIHDLARVLLEKVMYHSQKLNKKHEKALPSPDGTYKYLLDDGAREDFEKVDDIELPRGSFSSELPRITT